MRLCDFSHQWKTGNYVITWWGVKNLDLKPQLVGGGGGGGHFGPIYQKSAFPNVVLSINSGHTNISIILKLKCCFCFSGLY